MRTAQRDRAGERNSRKRTDHMEAGSHQHIWGLLLDGDRSINKFTALFTSHCVMGREGKSHGGSGENIPKKKKSKSRCQRLARPGRIYRVLGGTLSTESSRKSSPKRSSERDLQKGM